MMEVCKKTKNYSLNNFPTEVNFRRILFKFIFISNSKVRPTGNEILVTYPIPPTAYFIPPYQG
jgi:hypothetical protein